MLKKETKISSLKLEIMIFLIFKIKIHLKLKNCLENFDTNFFIFFYFSKFVKYCKLKQYVKKETKI